MKHKIILTGASDGIGKSMAIQFAKQGHKLGLIARREALLNEVKKECEKAGSPQVLAMAVDVTDEATFEAALNTLDSELGEATIFIANAGVSIPSSLRSDAWLKAKQTLMLNVVAAAHGLEVMKLKFLARKNGILCGVSSIAGARGMPSGGAYPASKAALTTYLETLRLDLKARGISVVTIVPGFIRTDMTKKNKGTMPFLMDADTAAKVYVDGVLKRKAWVVAPKPYGFIYPVLQMLPRWLFDQLLVRFLSESSRLELNTHVQIRTEYGFLSIQSRGIAEFVEFPREIEANI